MSEIKTYTVEETSFNSTVRKFLKKWHYSDYVNIQAEAGLFGLTPTQMIKNISKCMI